MSAPMDIAHIASLLADRADALARALLPDGHREGNEWVEASTRAGGIGDSLRVNIAKGTFAHFASADPQARGDMLDLVAYLKCGGDKGQAVRWARAWLGLDETDPATLEKQRVRAAADREDRERRSRADAEALSKKTFGLWMACEARLAGTLAGDYLAGRGIDLSRLAAGAHREPGALRFHPDLWEPETRRGHPALVAMITGAAGSCQAVHRTWLERRADGSVGKLSGIEHAKKSWGPVRGGGIRLWNGERIDPKTGEVKRGHPLARAEAGSSVVLTEGIEDALSVACACPEFRVICAVSLSNLATVALPPPPDGPGEAMICADNDAPGSQAAAALARAVDAHVKAGRTVRIVRPPEGCKDVNELLNQERNAG